MKKNNLNIILTSAILLLVMSISAQKINPGMLFNAKSSDHLNSYLQDLLWSQLENNDSNFPIYKKTEKNGLVSFLSYDGKKIIHIIRNKKPSETYVRPLSYEDVVEVNNQESDFFTMIDNEKIIKRVTFHNPSKSAEESVFYALVDESLAQGRNLILIDHEGIGEPTPELSIKEVDMMLKAQEEEKELEIEKNNAEAMRGAEKAEETMMDEMKDLENRNREMDEQMEKDAQDIIKEEERVQEEMQQEIERAEKAAIEASEESPDQFPTEEIIPPVTPSLVDPQIKKD